MKVYTANADSIMDQVEGPHTSKKEAIKYLRTNFEKGRIGKDWTLFSVFLESCIEFVTIKEMERSAKKHGKRVYTHWFN